MQATDILILVSAYLLGSIPPAVWVSKIIYKMDVREHGSLNAGLTNTFRVLGTKAAIPVAIVDLSKGIIAAYIGTFLAIGDLSTQTLCMLTGTLAIMGHSFTIFAGFKGGKGVLTALGMYIFLMSYWVLIPFGVFLLSMVATRYVSLSSILAAITLTAVTLYQYVQSGDNDALVLFVITLALATFVIYRHKENIKRLMKGEESRLEFSKKAS